VSAGRPRLRLPASVRRAIIDHAHRERPYECCGFLVGAPGVAHHAVAMANVERSAVRYRIDDRAHIDLRRSLRTFRPALVIIGVYHSHPNGRAEPSPTDVAQAMYPEWTHVIVGLAGARPAVRAFRITGGTARAVALE
jgi:proteasome lid subunit RPN8/RPN11